MRKFLVGIALSLLSISCSAVEQKKDVGEEFRDCANCPVMVVLPLGEGWLGLHPLETRGRANWRQGQFSKPLAVGKFEVLRKEYADCVDDGKCRPIPFRGGFPPYGDNPIYDVSWNDANTYVDWLAAKTGRPYRLLSNNEWEYAARGGTSSRYWWGDEFRPGLAVCRGCRVQQGGDSTISSLGEKIRVGPANAYSRPVPHSKAKIKPNPYGLYYMLGNVAEWVADCRDADSSYLRPNTEDAKHRTIEGLCLKRTFKGGHYWSSPDFIGAAISARGRSPDFVAKRDQAVGLRVALNY